MESMPNVGKMSRTEDKNNENEESPAKEKISARVGAKVLLPSTEKRFSPKWSESRNEKKRAGIRSGVR